MQHIKFIFLSFFISLLAACSKPVPDYSGTWVIQYGEQERILTITKNGDEYQIHDELKKTNEDKTIYSGQSSGTVNRQGELTSGQNDMINTFTLNENANQITFQTYDHQTIILNKK